MTTVSWRQRLADNGQATGVCVILLALICLGLYEQSHLQTPAHAALSEAVNAAKAIKKPWATGLVNGVLRNHQRSDITIISALSAAQRAALPDWLYDRLLAEYGD